MKVKMEWRLPAGRRHVLSFDGVEIGVCHFNGNAMEERVALMPCQLRAMVAALESVKCLCEDCTPAAPSPLA